MMRQFAQITLLTGTLLVGLVPLAMAGSHGMPPVSTGVVAQVTAVDPKTGTATLQTEDGEVFYESKYIVGKVGSKVECDWIEEGLYPQFQNCQRWN